MSLKLIPPGKRKGNRYFLVRGTLDGEQVERSTKTTSRRAAERFLEGLPAALRVANVRRETASFSDAVDLYEAWRSPGRNDRRYLARLRAEMGDKLLSEISQATLVQAAHTLYPGADSSTKNRQVLAPAAAVLHYAEKNGLCAWLRVEKFKEAAPEARGIEPELAALAISQARGPLKLLLFWLFRVGTRITETLGARLEHIDHAALTIRLKIPKTDEWHVYALPPEVLALLPRGDHGWVFPWRSRGGADKHRRKLCKRLGFTFTFHQCRHTFGTTIVNAGQMLDVLPHWKDPKSRARYGRPDIERVRAVMAASALPKSGKTRGVGEK